MGKKLVIFFTVFLLFGCVQTQSPLTVLDSEFVGQVYFCPEDACADKLINSINTAKTSVDVAIYSFTLDEIADSLISAKNRGVAVRVLFDASQAQSQYSEDERLLENGVEVKLLDKSRGIMHNKFTIIDSEIVFTGSFNYSQNADRFNDENLVKIESKEIAGLYESEFEELWSQS